jgi:signal transduction histidine kinase
MVFFTLSPLGYKIGFINAMLMEMIYFPPSILIIYGIIYIAIPKLLFKKRYLLFTFYILSSYLLDFGAFLGTKYYIAPAVGIPTDNDPIFTDFFWSILTFTFVAGIAIAIKVVSYNFRLKEEKVEMMKQNMESEMNLLRSKINPHFLFNVLNNIDEMIYMSREKASNYIFNLSNIMRYMLTEADKETSFLKEEIEYLKNYLELSEFSLPYKNFIEFNVNGELKQQQVPTLIFLPLIENVVKHSRKNKHDHILISFKINDENVILKTENKIRSLKIDANTTSGFGIENLKKRLQLIYKNNFTLEIIKEGDTYKSYLQILFL